MKIDAKEPRIPLHRLKYPLRQPVRENQIERVDAKSMSLVDFEREIVRDGAKRFEEWLSEMEVKC